MTTRSFKVTAAVVSDRGLSNKRPLNEDSYLLGDKGGAFAVADGVGGAQAGDVASRTAVRVLAETFERRRAGDDAEDLMEIAIQKANAEIHKMAGEDPQLAMMATTIVALHLDADRATIGHVGDSRLYRLSPGGELYRETEDHSMVEEEVRAGRMTPEQAAHHPGRNVISRALGVEDDVEVELKTIEVEEGTRFLLCSDGITRHIADDELRDLLDADGKHSEICAEMKEVCYARGAEDNLTALIVQVGERPVRRRATPAARDEVIDDFDAEQTLPTAIPAPLAAAERYAEMKQTLSAEVPTTHSSAETSKRPFSKVVVTPPGAETSGTRRPWIVRGSPMLTLAAIALGAAFYGGQLFERKQSSDAAPAAAMTPGAADAANGAKYERARREIDRAPRAMAERMTRESNGAPLESTDPEFLYLYGRAQLLSGDHQAAAEAFRRTISRLEQDSAAGVREPLRVEARISAAAAALKTKNVAALDVASRELDEVIETQP